jgi:ribosome biogenesis protein BRX1
MVTKAKKRPHTAVEPEIVAEEVPLSRSSEDPPPAKQTKWTNKTRVLVLAARGISFRGRHLMDDIFHLMPHAKSDSKMQKKESLFAVNEIAEMKNCSRCLLIEGRRKRDVFLWAANVARGPSVKFEVENIHTMAELKMTGNCLAASRPFLSFCPNFSNSGDMHWQLMKELLTGIFTVPNHHPKSQPFFDHVYTFSVVDGKVWFRNYQILEEDGALAEIGPRMVLNPIKIFDGAFCGQTLWENSTYVTPCAKRSMLKKVKAGKYQKKLQSKAEYEASRPTESTYKVDETEDVFKTIEKEADDTSEEVPRDFSKAKKMKNKKKHLKSKPVDQEDE